MMADASAVGLASLSIGQAIPTYSFFLPRISEVRRADPSDPAMRSDVYLGQVAAAAMSISVGGMLTMLTGSQVPLWTSVIMALLIAGTYHYALENAHAIPAS